MLSVTQRISTVEQPKDGYVPIKLFQKTKFYDDMEIFEVESAFSSIMGIATDYLTRYMSGTKKDIAFQISLMGAKHVDEINESVKESEKAKRLLSEIRGIDQKSIYNACQLVGYDVAIRKGAQWFEDVDLIQPTENVIHNINVMVKRSLEFIKNYGPITLDGFTFEGGYTRLVSSGDGDFLTKDTLWDFKVSKNNISQKWSLQLLMYYILGIHSIHKEFKNIKNIGIFNPLQNVAYIANLKDIDDESFYRVSHDVLGYKLPSALKFNKKKKDYELDYSEWRVVLGFDNKVLRSFLNRVFVKTNFNPDNYENGIYDISVDDYWTYYANIVKKDRFAFKPLFSSTSHVKFLKRNRFIMFISVSKGGSLCVLHGGSLKKVKMPIEFYYNHLEEYAEIIIKKMSKYWKALYSISEQIREIKPDKGMLKKTHYSKYVEQCKLFNEKYKSFNEWYEESGKNIRFDGKVHGCIVDLDFFNHIYLNPNDGTIASYSAVSMYDKNVYKNLPSLIAAQRPEMLPGYKEIVKNNKNSLLVYDRDKKNELIVIDEDLNEEFEKVYSYDMYSISNRIKALQTIYDHGLVSVWYDSILGVPLALPKVRNSNLLGQSEIMNCGMRATVIKDVGYRAITVEFEDGTIVDNVTREAFKKKRIKNPKLVPEKTKEVVKREKKNYSYLGKMKRMHCGMNAVVVEDNGCKDITIQFEDGMIKKHCRRDHFDLCKIGYSNVEKPEKEYNT